MIYTWGGKRCHGVLFRGVEKYTHTVLGEGEIV